MAKTALSQPLIGSVLLLVSGCTSSPLLLNSSRQTTAPVPNYCAEQPTVPVQDKAELTLTQGNPNLPLLQQSWLAFRDRFIQPDGRVIDREVSDRSTSEGQAYAMLRAVLINDHDTFARTLTWGENNLARKSSKGERLDQLWASSWGKSVDKGWRVLDPDSSSDADVDATTALILASRRWNCDRYLAIARSKLNDLWKLSTTVTKGRRYLLPVAGEVFWSEPDHLLLNPSYFAPYAFRLFAQTDPKHDWISLVESSYQVLNGAARVSRVGLPSDWVLFDFSVGRYVPLSAFDSRQTLYGYDAYRVWWRVVMDAVWFKEPRAERFLRDRTAYLQQLWRKKKKIPAQLDLQGNSLVDYEATAQYAMLYSALQLTSPDIAQQIYQLKLKPRYQNGFWDDDSAFYAQNLAWFSLLASTPPTPLLRPLSSRKPLANRP